MVGQRTETYPEMFAALARSLAEMDGVRPRIEQIVARSVDLVPCDWAAVAVAEKLGDRPPGLAATTDTSLMVTVAEIAGRVGVTPGLTAFGEGTEVYCANLAAESKWASYAREMVRRTPIRSVLSYGLRLRGHPRGVLTFYAAVPGGFDEDAQRRGSLLADHATIAVDAATSADIADSLKAALESNRVMGTAMGVLAERHGITLDAASDLLRMVSNRRNSSLSDLAEQFMRTGELEES